MALPESAQEKFNIIENNFSYLNQTVASKAIVLATRNSEELISDGQYCYWPVTHNLGNNYLVCALYNAAGQELLKDVVATKTNVTLTILSDTNIAANSLTCVIFGIANSGGASND